jgi:hypothetical protein
MFSDDHQNLYITGSIRMGLSWDRLVVVVGTDSFCDCQKIFFRVAERTVSLV